MINIDHFYITVTDLDKAIDFYQKLLGKDISNREKNRWADFKGNEGEVYFGIYNATVDGEKFSTGSSPTLSLKTDTVDAEYERIKGLNPKSISKMIELTQPARYKYFQFEDDWGNVWEVAEYNY